MHCFDIDFIWRLCVLVIRSGMSALGEEANIWFVVGLKITPAFWLWLVRWPAH